MTRPQSAKVVEKKEAEQQGPVNASAATGGSRAPQGKKKSETQSIDSKKDLINQELTQINEVESAILKKKETESEVSETISSSKRSEKESIKESMKEVNNGTKKPRKRSITVGSGIENYVTKIKDLFFIFFFF